jgi:hypothetical protein
MINEQTGKNYWGAFYMRLVDLGDFSEELQFYTDIQETSQNVPVYESKMVHAFDHRFSTFEGLDKLACQSGQSRLVSLNDKQDSNFKVVPRYFVPKHFFESLMAKYPSYKYQWLLVWRDVSNATNERTSIATIIPRIAASRTCPALGLDKGKNSPMLLANLNALVFDYLVRQKVGGMHFNWTIVKQLPVIPPEVYTSEDVEFISSRVLELIYTAWDLQPFAQDMGYDGEPFIWDSQRRALLRAELDAYYAKLYGLTRDELRYILDPADVYGSDFPSETFRVLKNNEIKQFGEYRTQRLVLEAWDRMFG